MQSFAVQLAMLGLLGCCIVCKDTYTKYRPHACDYCDKSLNHVKRRRMKILLQPGQGLLRLLCKCACHVPAHIQPCRRLLYDSQQVLQHEQNLPWPHGRVHRTMKAGRALMIKLPPARETLASKIHAIETIDGTYCKADNQMICIGHVEYASRVG